MKPTQSVVRTPPGAGSAGLRLRKPLPLTVESLGNTFAVGIASLRVYGAGTTLSEAVTDFWRNLESVYRSYATTPPDELSREARQYLRRLRGMVEAD